ncbi:transposase [Streptomyces eurythermus]|uniref:transposase n=1 Tax=Streptomyces sp. DSM 40868 TaxID=2721173 RepID=UPI0009976001|nr:MULTISPECIES: transposase [Streptomyces]
MATGQKRYEADHDWLTTVRLPPYAPDLNPIEAVWSLVWLYSRVVPSVVHGFGRHPDPRSGDVYEF